MKSFSMKLGEDDLALLAAQAAAAGEKPASYARRLLQSAIRSEPHSSPKPKPEAVPVRVPERHDLRRALWCILVALSADLDEDKAREFIETYFDAPKAPGYAPAKGGAKP